MLLSIHLPLWSEYCYNPIRYLVSWIWCIRWDSQWFGLLMETCFYSSSSICSMVDSPVLDGVYHPSFWWRRSWLRKGIWRYELSPNLDVLLRTCGFRPFLQGLVVIVVLAMSSGLREVIQSRDPKWSVGEVVAIALHWTPCGVVDTLVEFLMEGSLLARRWLLVQWNIALSDGIDAFVVSVCISPLQRWVCWILLEVE